MRRISSLLAACGLLVLAPVAAAAADESLLETRHFRLGGEIKVHFRDTQAVEVRDDFPFPPSFLPPGEDAVFLRTPDPGGSFELSTVTLTGDLDFGADLVGRIEVHFQDLYNRNPTSTDEEIQLRQAWLRWGPDFSGPEAQPGKPTFHLLVGKAPRFSKQRVRRLESYGLWGTAVARFEEMQLEIGGTVGPHLYWRAQVASGNPLFMRDPNALAGDNGTADRVPNNVTPDLQSGFPILYDAKATDVDFDGRPQLGAGLGWRSADADGNGYDVVAWYFRRTLADHVALKGTFYSGDIKLLQGPFFLFPLPIHGDEKREYGVNFDGHWGEWSLYGQYVDQEIAGLPRSGAEVEVAWRYEIAGILVGETPVFRWIQPALRYSFIDNDFETPDAYPNPAVGWNWVKTDLGVRVGVVPGVDLTAEYSRNEMHLDPGTEHLGEFLLTVRAGF